MTVVTGSDLRCQQDDTSEFFVILRRTNNGGDTLDRQIKSVGASNPRRLLHQQ